MSNHGLYNWFEDTYCARLSRPEMRVVIDLLPFPTFSQWDTVPSMIPTPAPKPYVTVQISCENLEYLIKDLIRIERETDMRYRHRDLAEEYDRYQALLGLLSSIEQHS